VWAATTGIRLGEYVIGVRSNTLETDAVVRRLATDRVVEGADPPANYSIVIPGSTDDGFARPVSLLYRSWTTVVRGRQPARVLRGLAAHLAGHLEAPPGTVRIEGLAAVRGGGAALLPRAAATELEALDPRLHRRGIRLVDMPYALVDPSSGLLIVPEEPGDGFDASAWHDDDGRTRGSGPQGAPPGAYRFEVWIRRTSTAPSRAASVAAAMSATENVKTFGAAALLDVYARLFSRTRVIAIERVTADDISRALDEVLPER